MPHQLHSVCRANQKTPRRRDHNENSTLKNDSHSYLSSSHPLSPIEPSTARMTPLGSRCRSPQPQASRPQTPSIPSRLPRPSETPIAKRQGLMRTATTPMASGRSTPVVKEGEPGFYKPRIVDIPARNKTSIPAPPSKATPSIPAPPSKTTSSIPAPPNRPAPGRPSPSKPSPRDKELPSRPRTIIAGGAGSTRNTYSHDNATGTAMRLCSGAPSLTDHQEVKSDEDTDSLEQVDEQLARRLSGAPNLTDHEEVKIEKDTDGFKDVNDQPLHRLSVVPSLSDPEEVNDVNDLYNAIKDPDNVAEPVEQSLFDAIPNVGRWLDLLQTTDEDRPESPKEYLDFNQHYTGSRWSVDSDSPSPTAPQPDMTNNGAENSSHPEPEPEHGIDPQPGSVKGSIIKSPTMSDFQTKSRLQSISSNVNTLSIQPLNAAQEFTRVVEDSQTRAHTPSPCSFSQPRISSKRSSLPGTPTVASIPVAGSRLASRIPISDPKKTPNRVSVKPSQSTPILSGGDMISDDLPVVAAASLATLEHASPQRQKSKTTLRSQASSTPRSPSSAAYNLAQKVSLTKIKSKIRRVTPSPLEGERLTRRGVPRKSNMAIIGHRAGSRVRKLSDQLGSGGRSFPPISSPTNFQHVAGSSLASRAPTMGQADTSELAIELGLAVTTPGRESPIARTLQVTVPEMLADSQPGRLPGATIEAQDRVSEQRYAATLTLLERGEPPNMPTQDEIVAFAETYGTQPRQSVPSEHDGESIIEMTPDMLREAAETLQTCADRIEINTPPSEEVVEQTRQTSRRPSDRVPRYMAQTASQRRRVSKPLPRDDKSISSPSRPSSKASRTFHTVNKEKSPKLGVGKRTPSRITGTRSGSPGHTPLIQHAMNSSNLPRAPPSSPQAETILSMPGNGPAVRYVPLYLSQGAEESDMTHDGDALNGPMSSDQPVVEPSSSSNGRPTPHQPTNKIKHRPRSESKSRFISNMKGFFTKREVAPPVPTVNTTRTNQSTRGNNLSSHGNPEHGRSSIRVAEPAGAAEPTRAAELTDAVELPAESTHAAGPSHAATVEEAIPSDDEDSTVDDDDNPTIRVTQPTQPTQTFDYSVPEPLTTDPEIMASVDRFSHSVVSNVGATHNNDSALRLLVEELSVIGYAQVNIAKRAQIFSLTQVFLCILSNSKKAAISSQRAIGQAGLAKGYYDMVQTSIEEVGRQLYVPANAPPRNPINDVLRRMGVRTAH